VDLDLVFVVMVGGGGGGNVGTKKELTAEGGKGTETILSI
jgi:hypothetical protein